MCGKSSPRVSPCNPIPLEPIPSLKVRCRCAEALGMVKSGEESRVSCQGMAGTPFLEGWKLQFGGFNVSETGGKNGWFKLQLYRSIHHPSLFVQQIKSTFFRISFHINVFKTIRIHSASLMGQLSWVFTTLESLITCQEEAKALVEARGSRSSLPETNRRRLHKKT